jgi:hypothetical protein
VEPNDLLTTNEMIMISIFSGLYGIAVLAVIYYGYAIVSFNPSFTNFLLFFFMFVTFFLRCLYLAMFAAGYFRVEGAASYLLVEPPSFFILSIASLFVMSYGYCVCCLEGPGHGRAMSNYIWLYWFAFTIVLYTVMAVVLSLLSELDRNDKIIFKCYGQYATVQEDFTVQTIRISYHSFLFCIAVISAFYIFYFERKIQETIESASLSTMSILSCFSVLGTSVLWVIYSAVSGSTPYFVIPLWFCEVPPLLATCMYVMPRLKRKKERKSRKS